MHLRTLSCTQGHSVAQRGHVERSLLCSEGPHQEIGGLFKRSEALCIQKVFLLLRDTLSSVQRDPSCPQMPFL